VTIHLEAHQSRDWWRWTCPCGRYGVWLNHMEIALRNAALHKHFSKEQP
jgi:hypothetical protein